jgi:hypothetical protein
VTSPVVGLVSVAVVSSRSPHFRFHYWAEGASGERSIMAARQPITFRGLRGNNLHRRDPKPMEDIRAMQTLISDGRCVACLQGTEATRGTVSSLFMSLFPVFTLFLFQCFFHSQPRGTQPYRRTLWQSVSKPK